MAELFPEPTKLAEKTWTARELTEDCSLTFVAGGGDINVTRWAPNAAQPLPRAVPAEADQTVAVSGVAGFIDYNTDQQHWYLNFSGIDLFVPADLALGQNEQQMIAHPVLACVRKAMLADECGDLRPRTKTSAESGDPTPVLVRGARRVFELKNFESYKQYEHELRFAPATTRVTLEATILIWPPQHSNILAIAAPRAWRGSREQNIRYVLVAAYTGFRAAETLTPGATVHTGYWGCGEHGDGNRRLMVALQIIAARLAHVKELVVHFDTDSNSFEFGRELAAAMLSESRDVDTIIRGIHDCFVRLLRARIWKLRPDAVFITGNRPFSVMFDVNGDNCGDDDADGDEGVDAE